MIQLQRVYDYIKNPINGYTLLVDRLWPRGIKKSDLNTDEWLKAVAPSNALRKWFHHDPDKWTDFKKKYIEELNENRNLIESIKNLEKTHRTLILLFAAKDLKHNHALVLKNFLDSLS